MHWVGDGFPVYNLFSYDRLGQTLSPFLLLEYRITSQDQSGGPSGLMPSDVP
ncbi:hypothetical protein ACTXQV_74185, partial [Klebsiella pneumoniae]